MANRKQLILAKHSHWEGRIKPQAGHRLTMRSSTGCGEDEADLAPLAGLPHSHAAAVWKAGAGANVCRGDGGLWLSLENSVCHFSPCMPPRKIIKATRNYTEWPSPFHFEI